MASQTVVVLGGGVGGLVVANELRKKLGEEHRVVLVDREGRHIFTPSFLWLMTGDRRPEKIVRDLAPLERKGIEVVKGDISVIDPVARTIQVNGSTLEADYIVVSLGADLAPEQIPGLAEAGLNLYTLDGATSIRDARLELRKGNLAIVVVRLPFKCPAAPYEAAMLLEADIRRRGLAGDVSITLFSPEPGPMGVAGPEASSKVRGMVESKGIDYRPEHFLQSVDPATRTLRFADGAEHAFDMLIYIPPHVAPSVVQRAGLTNDAGWVPVDRGTLETSNPGVFAIGDVTTIPLTVGLPLPKAGTFAYGQAKAVAKTIAARISGRGEEPIYNGFGECFIETGNGRAGVGRGDFYGEPRPDVKLYRPTRLWHWWKIWFEWRWLRRWV